MTINWPDTAFVTLPAIKFVALGDKFRISEYKAINLALESTLIEGYVTSD